MEDRAIKGGRTITENPWSERTSEEVQDQRGLPGRKIRQVKIRVIVSATAEAFEDDVALFLTGADPTDARETAGNEKLILQFESHFDGTNYHGVILYTD